MRAPEFEGRRRLKGEINLVPLINVVFLLLIFFMLSSTLATPDRFDVDLPESAQARASESEPIVVLVRPDGGVALNNRTLSIGELEPALSAARAAAPGAGVLLKADARATTADVVSVLRRARAAGIERVALATREAAP